jgi:hypothetical protein
MSCRVVDKKNIHHLMYGQCKERGLAEWCKLSKPDIENRCESINTAKWN